VGWGIGARRAISLASAWSIKSKCEHLIQVLKIKREEDSLLLLHELVIELRILFEIWINWNGVKS
jgi:hypothetical protein